MSCTRVFIVALLVTAPHVGNHPHVISRKMNKFILIESHSRKINNNMIKLQLHATMWKNVSERRKSTCHMISITWKLTPVSAVKNQHCSVLMGQRVMTGGGMRGTQECWHDLQTVISLFSPPHQRVTTFCVDYGRQHFNPLLSVLACL